MEMITQSLNTTPFTKQAIHGIFKCEPPFSVVTNFTSKSNPDRTFDSKIDDHNNVSIYEYINYKFFTDFNNYYDQCANMLVKNQSNHNSQYVWSNKQHVLMKNIFINKNNIEFIKCINNMKDNLLDFIIIYNEGNDNNNIKQISFTFQHDQKYLLQFNDLNDTIVNNNIQLADTLDPPKIVQPKSFEISNIILDNDDDLQHDIYSTNTKIGTYKCNDINLHELWYVYCDTTYVENNSVMEINIKRRTTSEYKLTWHTIQHHSNDISIFNNNPNLYYLQGFIYLNKIGTSNLIVKFNLNSMIKNHNLYLYSIPNYLSPSFRFKIVKDKGIKLNINNKMLTNFVVVGNSNNKIITILTVIQLIF